MVSSGSKGHRGGQQKGSGHPQDQHLKPLLDQLDKDLDRLRATYELFFMGVERQEPSVQRDQVKSHLRRLQEHPPRQTALKFRLQQLKARLVSLENHWNRTALQRENGTYRRDLARVKRREVQQLLEQAQVEPPPPTHTTSIGRPKVTSAADLTDEKLQTLYRTYLGARKRCGESADLSYDTLAGRLRRQLPELIKKTGATSVEFKVVIRDGKAVLKAVPRHG